MPSKRAIRSCHRCRRLKIRCDRTKPACRRCFQVGSDCSLNPDNSDLVVEVNSSLSISSATISISPDPPSPECTKHDDLDIASPDDKLPKTATAKKRNRAALSCVRCRRLKVKCDKQHPCGRCRLSGWAQSCTYTHRIRSTTETTNPRLELGRVAEDNVTLVTAWHARHRGLSHWKPLLSKFSPLADVDTLSFVTAAEEHASKNNDCDSENELPLNFPFNSPGAAKYVSMGNARDLIQEHRDKHHDYIDQYMELFHPIYPILRAQQFSDQVEKFWGEPLTMDVSWLAMFLMVLGLGSLSQKNKQSPSTEFFMAAEACLSKTPFMFRPNITSIRTLCLIIVAKQVSNSTCGGVDACWSFIGLVVRLAVLAGLHRPQSSPDGSAQSYKEHPYDPNLWITITYFSIQTSMATGMPNLLSKNDLFPSQSTSWWGPEECEEVGPWYRILEASSRTILDIVECVNSDVKPSYEEIVERNMEIRQLMKMLDDAEMHEYQRMALSIFFRRVLLTLHRPYALDADASCLYPSSYWASLECSLAILAHYRDIYDRHQKPQSLELVARLFMLDLFSATVTTCVHLLWKDAPLAQGYAIPPRKTIVDTLEACTDIWAGERERSVCLRTAYRILGSVMDLIKSGGAMMYNLP